MADAKIEESIKYDNVIRTFTKDRFPKFKMNSAGTALLVKLINRINDKFLKNFENAQKSADRSNKVFLRNAQHAVEKTLEGNLKKCAISEAHRQLAQYEMGLIEYKDTSVVVKVVGKAAGKKSTANTRPLRAEELCFRAGIKKLHATTNPKLGIQANACEFLSSNLHMFAKMVAVKVSERASDVLQPEDLMKVLPEYFGKAVMKGANSEGCKCLVLYENDLLASKPKETASNIWKKPKSVIRREHTDKIAFKSGVKVFLAGVDDKASMADQACQYLEHFLISTAKYIAEQAAENCASNAISEMTDDQLSIAVRSAFPPELKQHALIQGATAVSNYTTEMLETGKEGEQLIASKAKSAKKRKRSKTPPGRSIKKKRDSSKKSSSAKKPSAPKKATCKSTPAKTSSSRKTPSAAKKLISSKRSGSSKKSPAKKKSTSSKRSGSSKKSPAGKKSISSKRSGSSKKSPARKKSISFKRSGSSKKSRAGKTAISSKKTVPKKGSMKKSPKPRKKTPTKRKRSLKRSLTKEKSSKKMKLEPKISSGEVKLDFASYVTNYTPIFSPSVLQLPREVANHIGGLLENVCQKLITDSAALAAKMPHIDMAVVRGAVENLFPSELAEHAIACGANDVMLTEGDTSVDDNPEIPVVSAVV